MYAVKVMAQPKHTVVHPMLFANEERIKKIQSQTDEVTKQLQQNGRSLQLKIEKPANGVTIDIEDVSAPRNLQDTPNPGLSSIVIKQKTAANNSRKLYLHAYPGTLEKINVSALLT